MIKDGKGIGSKRKNYLSVPYELILAFSCQTAGALIDDDCELNVWSRGAPKVSIDFSKSNVDVIQIYQFLNNKISWAKLHGTPDYVDPTPPNMDKKQTKLGNMIDWLGDNAKQVSSEEIERKFKTEFPILLDDEKVEIVSWCGTWLAAKEKAIVQT